MPAVAPSHVRATVSDPLGQTHLTAVATLVQLERLLGLDGAPPPAPGLAYPDTDPQPDHALRVLAAHGIAVTFSGTRPSHAQGDRA